MHAVIHRVRGKTERERLEEIELVTDYREKVALKNGRPVSDTPPRTNLLAYRNNLLTLAGIARMHGVRLVFVTQATTWNSETDPAAADWHWMTYIDGVLYRENLMDAALESYNDVMRTVGEETGVPVLDLARTLPKTLRYLLRRCPLQREGVSNLRDAARRLHRAARHDRVDAAPRGYELTAQGMRSARLLRIARQISRQLRRRQPMPVARHVTVWKIEQPRLPRHCGSQCRQQIQDFRTVFVSPFVNDPLRSIQIPLRRLDPERFGVSPSVGLVDLDASRNDEHDEPGPVLASQCLHLRQALQCAVDPELQPRGGRGCEMDLDEVAQPLIASRQRGMRALLDGQLLRPPRFELPHLLGHELGQVRVSFQPRPGRPQEPLFGCIVLPEQEAVDHTKLG